MQTTQKTDGRSITHALTLKPKQVIEQIENADLKGRGGAHFPTAMKWRFTREEKKKPKILICNADEGEPGTFKDRFILRHNPEALIEGIAIAAYAIGVKRAYIYLRYEYQNLRSRLQEAIYDYDFYLRHMNLQLDIFMGQGAYICGDETAIMNSIEGVRGEPRAKPPYPARKGVFGLPTCVNNVSTLANVAFIMHPEIEWHNLALFSVSGNVIRPGIYEYVQGVPAGRLINESKPKETIKALFFGAAGGCVPYIPDMTLDNETVSEYNAFLGSFAVIAVDVNQSIPHVCKNIADFFVHESCGRCTPCREGNYQVQKLLQLLIDGEGNHEVLNRLRELSDFVTDCSFCGLGQTSTNHLKTALTYFEPEFDALCMSESTISVT